MTHDKQLRDVKLDQVVEKRRLDQALNAKEFAVLAGISYSAARAWFRLPGFPAFRGVVFWQDFVQWRTAQIGSCCPNPSPDEQPHYKEPSDTPTRSGLPERAARILAQAG